MAGYRRSCPTIGVLAGWQVFAGVIDSFLEHVIRGIQAAAEVRGCNLLLGCGEGAAASFNHYRPGWPVKDPGVDFLPVGAWNCDGLIFVPPFAVQACQQYAADLEREGHPVVFAGLQGVGPGVGVDNEMGIRQAAQHLYQHGHRRIAFIAGFDEDIYGDSGSRLQGYRAALEQLGLAFDPELMAYGHHEFSMGQQAMQQILARKAAFSAVLASNDISAMGAMEALRQAGYLIPRDVAVIGFDNRIETRAQVPPLTTIHFPMFELGYQSLEMILDSLDGKVSPGEIRKIPTHLVIRESCGCLPGETGKPRTSAARVVHHPGDRLEQDIAAVIETETHRMQRRDVAQLAGRFVEAYREALALGAPSAFLNAFQEILERVSACQDDLFTWQHAITMLRESPSRAGEVGLSRVEIEAMLDRARLLASEAAKAQAARRFIRQSQISEQLQIMTSKFFAAQDEDEIFNILNQYLPSIGVERNAVLYFKSQDGDPVACSALRSPHPVFEKGALFSTYQFPPPGLFLDPEPFHYALLPLSIDQVLCGYAALKVGPLEPLTEIMRQLAASLYAVRLRQKMLEGQRLAEEANQLKSRFLSMVSHELRAPLNLIAGLSDILIKSKHTGSPADFSWEDLDQIYASAQHLDGLIQDVLDLSLSDVGQLKLNCEPLNLKDVLDPAAVICKSLIQDKGLAWRYEVADALPPVWGDRTRLRQVTLNLLHNALKFTGQGEVALRAFVDEQGRVTVTVSDTGLGIPPGEQEIIFEEFRQSGRTASRGYGGLGLGLAICKRLVELHGGEIRVYSSGQKDEGAVFTFTLPPMMGHRGIRIPVRNSYSAVSLPRPTRSDQALRVLLLAAEEDFRAEEDLRKAEEDFRKVEEDFRKGSAGGKALKDYLEAQGYEVGVYAIGGGEEWLSQALNFNPDAVILDLEITAERGWEILKVLRENPSAQDLPVLFYSMSNDGQRGSFLELDYLSKPIKSEALGEALRHYLAKNGGSNGRASPVVVVVDDDANAVELHSRLVRAQFPSARVHPAYDGRQALALIRQETPMLVLLDLLMPEMDGFAVLSEMRANPGSREVPVIVITSQSLNHHDIARLNQGMVSILGKNMFSQEETLQHISAFLENRHRRSAEARQTIFKAMAFIHANYKESISRNDIASHVGLSERHLDRCFHQSLGISPITYLNRYRVNQARALLETQKIGITAVAMEVGFSSSGYFARVFRDEMGVSPRAYIAEAGFRQNKKI